MNITDVTGGMTYLLEDDVVLLKATQDGSGNVSASVITTFIANSQ